MYKIGGDVCVRVCVTVFDCVCVCMCCMDMYDDDDDDELNVCLNAIGSSKLSRRLVCVCACMRICAYAHTYPCIDHHYILYTILHIPPQIYRTLLFSIKSLYL